MDAWMTVVQNARTRASMTDFQIPYARSPALNLIRDNVTICCAPSTSTYQSNNATTSTNLCPLRLTLHLYFKYTYVWLSDH